MSDYVVTLTDTVDVTDLILPRLTYIAPVYTDVETVCDFLQVDLPSSGPGQFGWNYIERLIKRAEDKIDKATFKAWRPRYRKHEYHKYNNYGIKLMHRPIREIKSLEIWADGWQELTEGRSSSFWVDNRLGIIYFTGELYYPWGIMRYRLSRYPMYQMAIRVSYVWGFNMEDDFVHHLQGDEYAGVVRDTATKMVGIELLSSNDYTRIFPTGMDNITLPEKKEEWKLQIDEMLEELKDFVMF